MILCSTAWMTQPATRTFRIVLKHEPETPHYVVTMQFAKGDCYHGDYFPYVMEGEDQQEHLQAAMVCFIERAAHHLQQTTNCSERLLPEFEPFLEGTNSALSVKGKVNW